LAFELFATPVEPDIYCTAGTTSNGCVASISASDQPSVTLANPCVVNIANVEGQKTGVLFYGINGPHIAPWGLGSTSYLCVKAPTQRMAPQNSGGSIGACNGVLSIDWNAFQTMYPAALGNPWNAGDKVWVQGWFRDPPAPKTTNLSDGLELTYVP
jgi:hypothetical protein